MKIFRSFFICLFISTPLFAKDFGHHGHVFEIKERNLLLVIQEKLTEFQSSGEISIHQTDIQEKVRKKALSPEPVLHIQDATQDKTFYFDPTVTVPFDLSDHKENVFYRKGQKVNPLDMASFTEILYFINGENSDQIEWLRMQLDETSIVILTKGKPEKIHEILNHEIYFDQSGIMTKRLRINAVPARVSQEEKQLKIEEFYLKRGNK